MKNVINGVVYDTDKAEQVLSGTSHRGGQYIKVALLRRFEGKRDYFLYWESVNVPELCRDNTPRDATTYLIEPISPSFAAELESNIDWVFRALRRQHTPPERKDDDYTRMAQIAAASYSR